MTKPKKRRAAQKLTERAAFSPQPVPLPPLDPAAVAWLTRTEDSTAPIRDLWQLAVGPLSPAVVAFLRDLGRLAADVHLREAADASR